MDEQLLAKGTLVTITSDGPFSGCKGIIRAVDVIGTDGPYPVVFYLVALHVEPTKELWFDHGAVAAVSGTAPAYASQGERKEFQW